MSVFDIQDQAALTELVNREINVTMENEPFLGAQIAPLTPVQDRVVKMETVEFASVGKGQFKAPDSTPALYTPKVRITEDGIELALLEEMTLINESKWMQLSSKDEDIRRAAGVDIISRGKALQMRNERLTEWMRWEAFKGSLTIRYPNDGQAVTLDYQLPASNKPTAGTPWTNRSASTPITDLRAWQKLTSWAVGKPATVIHMNSDTWEELQFSVQVRSYLTDSSRDVFLPEESDIARLLRTNTKFVIYDGGFRPEEAEFDRTESSVVQFIPDGYVFLAPEGYTVDGERIADVPDGLVSVSTGYNQLELRQGAQSEAMVDHSTKGHIWRQASARIPRIKRPASVVWAKVY